jgi:hypothetical protein
MAGKADRRFDSPISFILLAEPAEQATATFCFHAILNEWHRVLIHYNFCPDLTSKACDVHCWYTVVSVTMVSPWCTVLVQVGLVEIVMCFDWFK